MAPRPTIIQGGMGIGISGWRLARKVSAAGQLGVVSGTGIWVLAARMLQDGDTDGHLRRAFAAFPNQEIVREVLERYYQPGGRTGRPYRAAPMLNLKKAQNSQQATLDPRLENLMVLASFAEVWLAKAGHDGVVGINLLEKIQLMQMPVLYGALLAGVDYVLVGAGMPIQIPEVLDLLAAHQPAAYRLHVEGAAPEYAYSVSFNPTRFGLTHLSLSRASFLAVISTDIVATILANRAKGSIEGFVVERPTAGGHNAPPRGKEVDASGQPVYGDKDRPNLSKIAALGRPFWLAGSTSDQLSEARALGAAGVQVGTIFALSQDSGLDPTLRARVIAKARAGELVIRTDGRISPTGYPFKCAELEGTITDLEMPLRRQLCDIGALRTLYRNADGQVGYRCPAEPLDHFIRKGGREEDALGRACLCNGLTATMGLGQVRPGGIDELPLVTLGDDLGFLTAMPDDYTAEDALAYVAAH
ncbi:MAG: nitronate monooxygenase [Armatimonadetes bacterium]|nr:nitronate monooxygenase [Armatimonadota bacterium]MDE2207072.1 nitronate monooxygenase [Armatimonadota bacterium]